MQKFKDYMRPLFTAAARKAQIAFGAMILAAIPLFVDGNISTNDLIAIATVGLGAVGVYVKKNGT